MAKGVSPIPEGMPASQEVYKHISFKPPKGPSVAEKLRAGYHEFQRKAVDDLHAVEQFTKAFKTGGEKLSFEENPYIASRLLRGVVSKAGTFLEKGTFGPKYWKIVKGKAVPDFKGPGLKQIMQPLKTPVELERFATYLTARRVVGLTKRGIETGIKKADARKTINEIEKAFPKYKETAQKLYKYQDDLLDYMRESGAISAETVANFKKFPDYVPFFRVLEQLESRGFMGKKMADVTVPIKRIKGSELDIINPLEGIVKNTYALISAADRNRVGIMMANMVKRNPELTRLFKEIPVPTARVAKVGAKELGIDTTGLSVKDAEAMVDIFRPSMLSKDDVVTVLMDGKKHFFKVDPDLYRGLLALDRETLPFVIRALSPPAKWLRAGATLNPEFAMRNPVRDQLSAFTYSRFGFVPGFDFVKGMFSSFTKGSEYWLYRASGAEHAMLVSMDRSYMNKTFNEVIKGKPPVEWVKNPIEILRILSETGEKATRLGEFGLGIRKGVLPTEAGFASREVTLDFAKMGTSARAVNQIVAFFNANIRGWDRMQMAFREKPIETSLKVFAGITMPSILLYMANRKDPRWKEIPQWQKDLFWIVMTEDHIYRIPKPFELGILFGSIPERSLEWLDTKDPGIMDEVFKNAIEAGNPFGLPNALLPIVENMANHSFFRDRPIVPRGKEALEPELQYTRYTSEVAKKLGEVANYSPAKIDNLFRGYTAGLGRYATEGVDIILRGTGISPKTIEPSPTLSDLPLIRAFAVRDPYGSSSESVDRFYKKLKQMQAQESFLKEMLKAGNEKKFESYSEKHPDTMLQFDWSTRKHYSATARFMRKSARLMSEVRTIQEEIFRSKTMTPQEKRIAIDKTNKIKTEMARRALIVVDDPSKLANR